MDAPIIVLEGLDGCGKSTLAALLASALDAQLLSSSAGQLASVRATCDALHGPSGLSRQLYYTYAVSLVSEQARGLAATGTPVVIDRYWASTLVYAHTACTDAPWLPEVAQRLVPADLTVLLDLDVERRRERLIRRSPQQDPADTASLHNDEALRERLISYLPRLPTTGRLLILDAGAAPEVLRDHILRALAVSAPAPAASRLLTR
jgi:dTMP kinase